MDVIYNFVDPVTTKNAGHVYGSTNNLDGTRSQTFTYDQLNRVITAQTSSTYSTSPAHCWGEAYGLDTYGNLQSINPTTASGYTGCTEESGFSKTASANNQLSGFAYDSSGNTTSDGTYTYVWNAESQLKSVASVTYVYDGDGRRMEKSGSKLYWYDAGGEILAETNVSGTTTAEYIFFGGKRIAMIAAGSAPIYYVEDLLGTSRVVTSSTGTVCYDGDFYPYGGERAYTNSCPQNYKFEGKERDTETGNDDFNARYYSNRFGRWLSSDWSAVPEAVPYANLTNPQTLNLYAMVEDDPESSADLDGHSNYSNGNDECGIQSVAGNNKKAYVSQNDDQADGAQSEWGGDHSAITWHWVPDPHDPKRGRWVPDKGDTVCNTQSGICYRYDGKKWQPLSVDESRVLIVSHTVVKQATGPINILIVVAGVEVAAIAVVEGAPVVGSIARWSTSSKEAACVARAVGGTATGTAVLVINEALNGKSDQIGSTVKGGAITIAIVAAYCIIQAK